MPYNPTPYKSYKETTGRGKVAKTCQKHKSYLEDHYINIVLVCAESNQWSRRIKELIAYEKI